MSAKGSDSLLELITDVQLVGKQEKDEITFGNKSGGDTCKFIETLGLLLLTRLKSEFICKCHVL